MRELTQSQFARRKNLSRSTICKWVKEGKLTLTPRGKINPEQAEKELAANVTPKPDSTKSKRKHHRRKSSCDSTTQGSLLNGEPTFLEARRQTELLKAELLSLKVQVERGDLVPKEAQINWLCILVVNARTGFWNLPRRMGEVLALINDPREIECELRREIRQILEEMVSPLGKEKAERLFAKIEVEMRNEERERRIDDEEKG